MQVSELKHKFDAGENFLLLDVRDEYEFEISNIGGTLIPLAELPERVSELDSSREVVTMCKMGPRGVRAAQLLRKAGFKRVSNLNGGIHAWSDRVDRRVKKY
jgi:rhodanese-related sulfurtransferase